MKKFSHVMIVDDDSVSNFICSKIIDKADFTGKITSYEKAGEALSFLENIIDQSPKDLPEIIFLDINMPGIDGWGFLEAFRKFDKTYTRRILISMLSSSINQQEIDKAMSYEEVSEYIAKPLKKEALERISEKYESIFDKKSAT